MIEIAKRISPSRILSRADLSDLEKRVITLRYGIGTFPRTWQQIQTELGIARSQLRQAESRALRALRHVEVSYQEVG